MIFNPKNITYFPNQKFYPLSIPNPSNQKPPQSQYFSLQWISLKCFKTLFFDFLEFFLEPANKFNYCHFTYIISTMGCKESKTSVVIV